MKKLLLLSLLACVCAPSGFAADDKIIERSSKKQPSWVKNMTEEDFIIISAEAATIAEAQQQTLLQVKASIVRSIAEQITSTTTYTAQEADNKTSETYKQSIIARADKAPSVQGIAANQIKEFYWERVRRTAPFKEEFYRYYVKYPFSKAQMGMLIADFRAEEAKTQQRLTQFEAALSQPFETIEQITTAAEEISAIAQNADNPQRANMLYGRYNAILGSVYILLKINTLGHIEYQLMLGETPVGCTQKPTVKSACATVTQVNVGKVCSVDYTSDGCYQDVENFVEVSYKFAGKVVKQAVLIPL
jgi:hypothetical protein